MTDLGPPRIHSVVAARSTALKIKELSSSLLSEKKKINDEGAFAVTYCDDPSNQVQKLVQPSREELPGRRRSATTHTASASDHEHYVGGTDVSAAYRFLDPEEGGSRRQRSNTVTTIGFNEAASSDSESVKVPHFRSGDGASRRRRYTRSRRASVTTQSSGQERIPEHGTQENSFRTEPEKMFEHWKVTEIIKKTFEENLLEEHEEHDDRRNYQKMCKILADLIKEQVKHLEFSRHKIICIVSIGQKRGESVRLVSRCVWDPRHDSYAQYYFEKGDLFAFGVVYGVYYE